MKLALSGRRILVVAVLAGLLAIPAGVAVIIYPDNPLVRSFRAPVEARVVGSRLLTGPYPLEEDFRKLKAEGVTTIVSLLNPDIPYEDILLEREKATAARFGMEVKNFPMSSILGQRFGDEYDQNSEAAAQAVLEARGKVYLHCYLGLHRAQAVFDRLDSPQAIRALRLRDPNRSPAALASDEAEAAYVRGDYAGALAIVERTTERSIDLLQLRGWSLYKLGRYPESARAFERTLAMDPAHLDAMTGRGYALMQDQRLAPAETAFQKVLAAAPDRSEAWTGLGITLFRAGKTAEARKALERAIELEPTNGDAREVLAGLP